MSERYFFTCGVAILSTRSTRDRLYPCWKIYLQEGISLVKGAHQ